MCNINHENKVAGVELTDKQLNVVAGGSCVKVNESGEKYYPTPKTARV